MKVIAGIAVICIVVAVGVIRVDDSIWQHYRLFFPAGAGIGLGVAFSLIALGVLETLKRDDNAK